MELIINGEQRQVAATNVQGLLEEYDLFGKMVVVEIDGTIVDRSDWQDKQLEAGMKVELVHFVGGG